MTVHNFDPESLDPELLRAFGLVIAQANELEAVARLALIELLGLSARSGHIAFQRLGATAVLDTLADLTSDDLDPPPEFTALADAARQAKAAYDLRNRRAHSPAFIHGATGKSVTHSQKVKVGKDSAFGDITPEDVFNDAATICDARFALFYGMEGVKRLKGQARS